eukprot:152754-Chlamydomonas_euryale.AAC.1
MVATGAASGTFGGGRYFADRTRATLLSPLFLSNMKPPLRAAGGTPLPPPPAPASSPDAGASMSPPSTSVPPRPSPPPSPAVPPRSAFAPRIAARSASKSALTLGASVPFASAARAFLSSSVRFFAASFFSRSRSISIAGENWSGGSPSGGAGMGTPAIGMPGSMTDEPGTSPRPISRLGLKPPIGAGGSPTPGRDASPARLSVGATPIGVGSELVFTPAAAAAAAADSAMRRAKSAAPGPAGMSAAAAAAAAAAPVAGTVVGVAAASPHFNFLELFGPFNVLVSSDGTAASGCEAATA